MKKKGKDSDVDDEGNPIETSPAILVDEPLPPLSMRWQELSWKTLCDDEDWRKQFKAIR